MNAFPRIFVASLIWSLIEATSVLQTEPSVKFQNNGDMNQSIVSLSSGPYLRGNIGRKNVVSYSGHMYSTLLDLPIGCEKIICQDDLDSNGSREIIPPGWELAPNSIDSMHVIESHCWSTLDLETSDGSVYNTRSHGGSNSSTIANEILDKQGLKLSPASCNGHKLIRRALIVGNTPVATMQLPSSRLEDKGNGLRKLTTYLGRNAVSYNGYYYSTLDNVDPDYYTYNSYQTSYLSVPSGWELAPDNSDSIYVIGAHTWSTKHVTVSNGNGYRTSVWDSSTAGTLSFINNLDTAGSYYRPVYSNNEILIRTSQSASSPTDVPSYDYVSSIVKVETSSSSDDGVIIAVAIIVPLFFCCIFACVMYYYCKGVKKLRSLASPPVHPEAKHKVNDQPTVDIPLYGNSLEHGKPIGDGYAPVSSNPPVSSNAPYYPSSPTPGYSIASAGPIVSTTPQYVQPASISHSTTYASSGSLYLQPAIEMPTYAHPANAYGNHHQSVNAW